ncbi:MAG: hypothetical protein N2558_05095 [Patescibacteria group bacterium]|nr:hypothetical protein [Patescibacteria group bacterium]
MAGVTLDPLPKDKEFEEYIAAFFQSDGYFIEKNIVNRQEEEILELDVIITNYNSIIPRSRLCEMKSGEWGFPDIFKVRGWLDFTKLPKGLFIVQKNKPSFEFYKKISKELKISLVLIEDISKTKNYFKHHLKTYKLQDKDITIWRYSYWLERNFIKILNSKKKAGTGRKCYEVMESYYFKVNSGVFFTKNIVDRLIKLYDNFKSNPRLSAKVGNELVGNNFDDPHDNMPTSIFKETFYQCKLTDIQFSTFVEHTSKLTILKNLVDYTMFKQAGDKIRTEDILGFFGSTKISKLDFLPKSFRDSLEEISKHKYFSRYPVFWQWFLWFFGGFILLDYEEQEYKLMSEKTGIPIDEIPNALKVFDILFPMSGSWFFQPPYSNVKIMQMFPIPFRGIGANARRLYYTESGKFEDLKLTGKHTFNDLIAWNNLAVEVLDKKFK